MAYRELCTYIVLVRLLVWVMIDGADVTTSAGSFFHMPYRRFICVLLAASGWKIRPFFFLVFYFYFFIGGGGGGGGGVVKLCASFHLQDTRTSGKL